MEQRSTSMSKNALSLQLVLDYQLQKHVSGKSFPTDLSQNISTYNKTITSYEKMQEQDGGEEVLQTLLGQLDRIEHSLYPLFWSQKVPPAPEDQKLMFKILDNVQLVHKELIKKIVELDFSPWILENQEKEARETATQLWSQMTQRGGDGAFHISNETAGMMAKKLPRDARRDVQADLFASMARLISRPAGRSLLQSIHAQGLQGRGVTFTVNPTGLSLGALSPVAGPTGLGAECEWHQRGLDWQIVRGQRSGGQIACVVNLNDSDMQDFDMTNTLLPSPVFIGLGHELVHVAHYQNGSYIGSLAHFPEVAEVYQKIAQIQSLPASYQGQGSIEEFLTIPSVSEQLNIVTELEKAKAKALNYQGRPFTPQDLSALIYLNKDISTEADIRAEHGLGIRHAHRSIANPVFYPKATEENPQEFITGPKQWAERVGLLK